jgi:hypothetical protein
MPLCEAEKFGRTNFGEDLDCALPSVDGLRCVQAKEICLLPPSDDERFLEENILST